MIVDESLGLRLGERIRLGKDNYTVVGVTTSMISSSGDGIGFFTVADAQAIQFDTPGEAVRLERASREARGLRSEISMKQPALLEQAAKPLNELPDEVRAPAVLGFVIGDKLHHGQVLPEPADSAGELTVPIGFPLPSSSGGHGRYLRESASKWGLIGD
jgi:hypothetical protein